MKKITTIFLTFMLIATTTACGSSDKKTTSSADSKPKQDIPIDSQLHQRLEAFAAKPRPSGRFGLYVYDLTAGKEVFEQDADHAQPIASCMKLLSGVAALHRLGPKYNYSTAVFTRGNIDGDTLRGDIALKAGMDPQLQDPDMKMFAQALRRKGIRHITGKVILDLTLREKVQAEEHWYPWDLSFSKYGVLYKGPDRVARAFRQALAASGIPTKNDQYAIAATPKDAHCIFRFIRSVDHVTKRMWKNSSNTQATSMLYTIGVHELIRNNPSVIAVPVLAKSKGVSDSQGQAKRIADAGVAYLRQFLRNDLGQKDTALIVHDGCGLCTHNHLSPRALAAILIYAYNDKPIYKQLMQNLSISGVDGTLMKLISNPKLRGKIHAKTGTLSHPFGISSLAGYCKGADGHDLCFALLNSEMSVLDAHVLQRNLCLALTGQ